MLTTAKKNLLLNHSNAAYLSSCLYASSRRLHSLFHTEDAIEQIKINSDEIAMNMRAELLCQKEVLHN